MEQPEQNGGSRRGRLPVVSVGSALVSITMCALFVSGTLTLHTTPDLGPEYVYKSYQQAETVSVRNYSAWCSTLDVLPIDNVDYKMKEENENSWTRVTFNAHTNVTSQVASRTLDASGENQSTSRIVGGDAHNIKEFPFFVSLKQFGWHSCGGSLLTSNFVVSAAHCFLEGRPNSWTIQAGVSQQNQDGFSARVNAILIHADYNVVTLYADIALVRIDKGIPEWTDLIQPACIQWIEPVALAANEPVYVIGMGVTNEGGETSGQLLGVSLSVLSTAYCNGQFGANYIKSGMICAGYPPGGRDACQADSGGPLLHNGNGSSDYLVGLVSFGVGCARENYGGGYTSVKSYRQWIASTIQHVEQYL